MASAPSMAGLIAGIVAERSALPFSGFILLPVLIDEDADLGVTAAEDFRRALEGIAGGKRGVAQHLAEEVRLTDFLDSSGVAEHPCHLATRAGDDKMATRFL